MTTRETSDGLRLDPLSTTKKFPGPSAAETENREKGVKVTRENGFEILLLLSGCL